MENFLLDTIKAFIKAKVEFVICGGVACVLQGCDRTTFDLDINLILNKKNLIRFIDTCKALRLTPRIPYPLESILDPKIRKKWIKEKGALVYTVLSSNGMIQIDIFLDYPIPFNELKMNADSFEIDGFNFYISSREDLIKAKKLISPPREKDLLDIKQLEELINNEKN